MGFREIALKSGTRILLGKNEKNNDELMREFQGKDNVIIHTLAPGSPFCVIDNLKPSRKDIVEASGACVLYSQAWRDKKQDTKVNIFTGKNISKEKNMKPGTWKVIKSKTKIIKKRKIQKIEKSKI